MLHEPEYMACLLVNGVPEWMRHSAIRNRPITDADHCIRVSDWWYDNLLTEIPNFNEWYVGYKRWLWYQGFNRERGSRL